MNWCEGLGTVLANDEIELVNGKMVSERGGYPVVKKAMRQWVLRITAYADRLLEDLDLLDWPEHLKEMQRNWIGKSEGAMMTFASINQMKHLRCLQLDLIQFMAQLIVCLLLSIHLF